MRKRGIADAVGFAHRAEHMDEIVRRIDAGEGGRLRDTLLAASGIGTAKAWRVAIAPHDDYAYAGFMYPLALANIKARTVFIFGVAHKARTFGIENRLVFDSFTHWHGPYGDVKASGLREAIRGELAEDSYVVHDELQAAEHSVEAKIPFLQHFNRDVEIVSILVPAMPHARMREIAAPLAGAIAKATRKRRLRWGEDFALVISTDAVHYGDEDWGGRNFAEYGTGAQGYREALEHERAILADCLAGTLAPGRAALFSGYTVREDDWREYKWTWCGRYSVPFGLLAAWNLQPALGAERLDGRVLGYSTSIEAPRIEVGDLGGMGVTAPANPRHWVGYAAVGYL